MTRSLSCARARAPTLEGAIWNDQMTGQLRVAVEQVRLQGLNGSQITHASADDFAFTTCTIFSEMLADANDGDIALFETPDLAHFQDWCG